MKKQKVGVQAFHAFQAFTRLSFLGSQEVLARMTAILGAYLLGNP